MSETVPHAERPAMAVDIACVGFGPATGGFLTALGRAMAERPGDPGFASRAVPGMPLQVLCYERADGTAFGVSGVATRARGIRASVPAGELEGIPMATAIREEKLVYLMDPVGASRRSVPLRLADRALRLLGGALGLRRSALELPWIPGFLRKEGGMLLSIGQFNQWVAERIMGQGMAQVWPGMPVEAPLIEGDRVTGIRLVDQGTDREGRPGAGFAPGMEIRAGLTVVADGPVGPVGMALDRAFGLPEGHRRSDWAVGMKMVVELPEGSPLQQGTVIHTFGYPEPEIFGFLYVHEGRMASLGVFVPSWLDSPVRTAYRYLQHWMLHPYLWPALEGGVMRSWGAKSLQESGLRGEPRLAGNGYARIGEGSGSTNVLTGSGVDEAWTSGAILAEAVVELLEKGSDFHQADLEEAYVRRRRASWIQSEGEVAAGARDGFQRGVLAGLLGMGLAGLTGGRLGPELFSRRGARPVSSLEEFYRGRIPAEELDAIRSRCREKGVSLHDAVMERAGWPAVPLDGRLLVSHQDALLLGGKVQAPPGYADHVVFLYPHLCESCEDRLCVEVCSGQAITPGESGGVPAFDREKCVHCGACTWSCTRAHPGRPDPGNIELRAGAGGLHSAEN